MSDSLLLKSDQARSGRGRGGSGNHIPGGGGGAGASLVLQHELVHCHHGGQQRCQQGADGADDDGDVLSRQPLADSAVGPRGGVGQGTELWLPIREGRHRLGPSRHGKGRLGAPSVDPHRGVGGGAGTGLVPGDAKKQK